jgi:hypothetical protein
VKPNRSFRRHLLPLAILSAAACSKDTAGPSTSPVRLAAVQGVEQFVEVGGEARRALAVQATNPTTGRTVADVIVSWRLVEGGGSASVSPTASETDEVGVATTAARAGSAAGTYRFEATAALLVGPAPTFTVHAITPPVITSLSSTTVAGGQTVEIEGTGFNGSAEQHRVLFGGLRGTIIGVSPTRVTVRAPACLLTRSTDVRVLLGDVASNAVAIETIAGAVTPVAVAPGKRITIDDPADLSCVAVEGVPANARFLLILQNAARSASIAMRYELTAIATGGAPAPFAFARRASSNDVASSFEIGLRQAERLLGPAIVAAAAADRTASADPERGDQRDFNVLTADNTTRRISATVQHISQRAIIYVDQDTPSGGLTDADMTYFGALFDDPIHATDTNAFGQPSDIDANGRIIILFTPTVNRLTKDGASGFIAGYFYGCDLVPASRCSATNQGEIFYSMVPDPNGEFGDARSREVVRSTVPAVLAHEFQHMINFARKGDRLDVLWLSEGLAHAAEDLVGQALEDRGDIVAAADFRRPNYTRARFYLSGAGTTPLLAEESPGTLEQRGGAWLLVKYITGHFGGTSLLGRLTSGSETGVANIEQGTGQSWTNIYAGFATALWVDGATGIGGAVEPTSQFAGFALRDAIVSTGGAWPLVPPTIDFQDFQLSNTLPAGSQNYLLLDVPSATAMLRFGFTGTLGSTFESTTRPQLTLFRVR